MLSVVVVHTAITENLVTTLILGVLAAKPPLPTVAARDGAVFKGPQVSEPFTPTKFTKILFLNLGKSWAAITPTLIHLATPQNPLL
jgi:hypothetical protein